MLVNWKIEYCEHKPMDKQPPDYYVDGEPYWFYRYFNEIPKVDVIDISSCTLWEKFEKKICRFYIWQAIKAIFRMHKYDMVVSHGMQSGIVLSLWRRLFRTKTKHIVFDIGSFNSAAEKGFALKLQQFASKSIDGLIYHTSSQIKYYKKFFPWLGEKSKFIRFGTDLDFFDPSQLCQSTDSNTYMICVGYSKRDWETVVKSYQQLDTDIKLRLVGHVEQRYQNISGIEQLSFIPIQELINQIYNARFCVLPLESFNYSYGQMTLMQQMALGKGVIAAKVPSLVDYTIDKETAMLYQPKDANELCRCMQEFLGDPNAVDRIAKNAHVWLEDQCNEKIMAREIEQFFRRV